MVVRFTFFVIALGLILSFVASSRFAVGQSETEAPSPSSVVPTELFQDRILSVRSRGNAFLIQDATITDIAGQAMLVGASRKGTTYVIPLNAVDVIESMTQEQLDAERKN